MGYKEELLKKIEILKQYQQLRETNFDESMKLNKLMEIHEIAAHVGGFLSKFENDRNTLFGGKDPYVAFINKHQDIIKGRDFPTISREYDGTIKIPDVDFKAVLEAYEAEFPDKKGNLDQLYIDSDSKYKVVDHPFKDVIANLKNDVDALFDANEAKEIKESLDYANGELVEKKGQNLVDGVIEVNSIAPAMKAAAEFSDFVKSKGMDENVVVNNSGSDTAISAGLGISPENIQIYKPFLNIKTVIDEDYKEKILALDNLLKEENLLTDAAGGESGRKEYGLSDYFQKLYSLKKAITDQSKLQSEEEKKANLQRISQLSKETKDVSDRYEKVFDFIKKNFDLENMSLSGNIYPGRPDLVNNGNLEKWWPNLPPKFDFENVAPVIFLSGFSQLKSACQNGQVTVEEYLDDPNKAFLKGVENLSKNDDSKYYLPRSEENTLGKRLARMLVSDERAYSLASNYGMIGGRGLEFLANTDPNKENQVSNTIVTSVIKDYNILYVHSPVKLFGEPFEPNIQSIKNIFAYSEQTDELYKVSDKYLDSEGNPSPIANKYIEGVRGQPKRPLDQEYNRIMNAMKDFATQRKYMFDHIEDYAARDQYGDLTGLNAHSLGTVLMAGRDYFMDYIKENNLSIADIQDDDLRQEITNFIVDPINTTIGKHVKVEDLGNESLNEVKTAYRAMWNEVHENDGPQFIEQFDAHKHGRNANKTFDQFISANKGGWWERFRGTTSKQYSTLQTIAKEVNKEGSPCCGDDRALYVAAKAYKEYKMPPGTDFNRLGSTAKGRIEFCDSIINAYEAKQRANQLANQQNEPAPENNNLIQDEQAQADFQNQLSNDIDNKSKVIAHDEYDANKAKEKYPPEEGVQP